MNIAILLFDGVDLLDAGGPYEVFLTASRLARRDNDVRSSVPLFDVVTVTVDGQPVTAFGGLGLTPHGSSKLLPAADALIVPGAVDLECLLANRPALELIRHFASMQDKVVASVCTGAFLLAEADLLQGRNWTTHFEDIDLLSEKLGPEGAKRNTRWVDTGKIVTAGGLSSGIDMSLHLVHRLAGLKLAKDTSRQICYAWSELVSD